MPVTNRTVHTLDARGTILDWLVSPVWESPADDLEQVLAATGDPFVDTDTGTDAGLGRWVLTNGPDVSPAKEILYQRHRLPGVAAAGAPVTGGPVRFAEHRGTWSRTHCAEDGLVDWSGFSFTPQYRIAVATAVLEVDQGDLRTLRIASTGPWQAFLDGDLIAESNQVTYMEPDEVAVRVRLPSRTSQLQVVLWQVALRECRQILRVRIEGLPVRVVVRSPGADEFASARAEQLLDAVGLIRWGATERNALLVGPTGLSLTCQLGNQTRQVRLGEGVTQVDFPQLPEPRELVSSSGVEPVAGLPVRPPRFEELIVTVGAGEQIPLSRTFSFCQLPPRHRATAVGSPEQWHEEFVEHACRIGGVGGALASWARDRDATVTAGNVAGALAMLDNRFDCADFEALGLLHLLHRVPAEQWGDGVREQVLQSLLGLKYWIDEPGLDAMCYFTENHQLVWHTAELLAGELLGEEVFSNDGRTGAAHAEHGRELARRWLDDKLAGGFAEFDSNAYLAIDVLALVTLVEFCADTELVDLAAGLADRVLLSLAANSWRGSHASAHGRSYVPTLRSSRLEETAPIQWLLFGVGALNEQVLPAAVLATSKRYQIPEIARDFVDHPGGWVSEDADDAGTSEYWASQSFRGRYRFSSDLLERPYGSDTVIHRSSTVMLASAQDYRSGLPGLQEHIWGATLGPECQVFVTHPPNASVSGSARPNAWAGNRLLPRVRQHRGALLALYRIPADDPMGITHGWFPTVQFDRYLLCGDWIAGAVGAGYVALGTPGGGELRTTGPNAYAEVRPRRPAAPGSDGTSVQGWACVVSENVVSESVVSGGMASGSVVPEADTGTSFDDFVAGLAELESGSERIAVGHHGRQLELTWSGPFLVDGLCPDLNQDGVLDDPPPLTGPWFEVDEESLHYSFPGCSHEREGNDVTAPRDSRRHSISLSRGRAVNEPANTGAGANSPTWSAPTRSSATKNAATKSAPTRTAEGGSNDDASKR